jgi:hypothetical protein
MAAPDTPPAASSGPGVAVLLSTFNGERYLTEQLASLERQTYPNWRLYWRDDGSSDGTPAIVRDFITGLPDGKAVACPGGGRLRATDSFLSLLRVAVRGSADCFAFADQDDVWLPEKLAHGVAALRDVPPDRPGLYFCGRTLVDAALRPVGQVLAPRRPPGFPAALTQNLVPGCCMMLNRAAAELAGASPTPDGAWHDWWCYILVAAKGGAIIAGDTSDILYRQHDANLIGEPRGFWHRTISAARRGRGPFMTLFWRQITALLTVPALPDATRTVLQAIERGRFGGPLGRLTILRLPGFARQTMAETALFRLWFLLG